MCAFLALANNANKHRLFPLPFLNHGHNRRLGTRKAKHAIRQHTLTHSQSVDSKVKQTTSYAAKVDLFVQ